MINDEAGNSISPGTENNRQTDQPGSQHREGSVWGGVEGEVEG